MAQGAAHAYKFASVLGRILAELAVDGATPSAPELERVPDRPARPPRGRPGDASSSERRTRGSRSRVTPRPCRSATVIARVAHPAPLCHRSRRPAAGGRRVAPLGGSGRPSGRRGGDPMSQPAAREASLRLAGRSRSRASCCPPRSRDRRRGATRSSSASARRRTSTPATRSTPTLVVGYEAFQLTYDLLVGLRQERRARRRASPTPGSEPTDRVTFHIREACSGPTATPRDVRRRLLLVGPRDGRHRQRRDGSIGAGYLDPGLTDAGVTKRRVPRREHVHRLHRRTSRDRIFQVYVPILPEHVWGEATTTRRSPTQKFDPPLVGTGPVPDGRVADRRSSPASSATPTTGATQGFAGRGRPPVLPRRHRHDGPGAQAPATSTTSTT